MIYYDAHLHLDDRLSSSLQESFSSLVEGLEEAEVKKCILLHLNTQPWGFEELIELVNKEERVESFINIDPRDPEVIDLLRYAVKIGYSGLKLHPRLHGYDPDSEKVIELVQEAGKLGIPTLVDAFPDGISLMRGFSPLQYARLATSCPASRLIWAHMGGHKVLDFMLLAKRLDNVFLDCSYSLLYYRGSSITDDILYAMRSMRYKKIFYGSDYPDRSVKDTLDLSIAEFRRVGISDTDQEAILYRNAKEFFGW